MQAIDSKRLAERIAAKVLASNCCVSSGASDREVNASEMVGEPVMKCQFPNIGLACRDANPDRAREAQRRGLVIDQHSGNRTIETHVAASLALVEANSGDPLAALDYFTVPIRNYHDSGNTTTIRVPLAVLAAFLDRHRRYEPAATIAGFAATPLTTAAYPKINTAIAHLREVLGDRTHESLARKGATMTTAAMVTFAYDQIDQARTELEHPR